MNLKRFSIISLIIIAIIAVTSIVLGSVKVDNPLGLPSADKIVVYSQSSSGKTYTAAATPSKYERLKKEVEDMTKLSIFECMLNDYDLHRVASQDVNNTYPTFSKSSATSENYCIELIYEEEQEIIISFEGDTKVIEFYALIFTVEESSTGQELALYFSTTEGVDNYKTYTKSPILIKAKTNSLLDYITSSDFTGE